MEGSSGVALESRQRSGRGVRVIRPGFIGYPVRKVSSYNDDWDWDDDRPRIRVIR